METFDCLSPATNIWGHHFLAASAGTGKTFTIEHVVARALMSEENIALDQILIVTFTKAATRELRLRIQMRLRSCLNDLMHLRSDYAYLEEIINSGEESIKAAQDRVKKALAHFDAAQIYTIHGFCHRMLTLGGIDANITMGLSDPLENGYEKFAHGQIRDYLRIGLSPNEFTPAQIARALQNTGGGIERLCKRLLMLSEKTEDGLDESLEDIIQKIVALLPSVTDAIEIESAFMNLAKEYKGVRDRSSNFLAVVEEQLKLWTKIITTKQLALSELDSIIGCNPNLILALTEENKKKNVKPGDHPIWLLEMVEQLIPILQDLCNPKTILMRMALRCKKRLRHAEKTYDIHPPDRILSAMSEAIETRVFLEKVQEQFQVAIIDEFQDTDPLQWSIFEKLFVGGVKGLYLVGDPKQSIYAFRNADLYTYIQAGQTLGEMSKKSLSTNYRSSKELVSGLNALFSHRKDWLALPKLGRSLQYTEVSCGAQIEAPQDDKAGVHVWLTDVAAGRSFPSRTHEETILFPLIAKEIVELGYDFNAYAVLVKDRYQALRLQNYLKRLQIPSTSKHSGSVCKTKAYALMGAFFQALLFPRSLGAIKRLLSAPIITRSFDELLGNEFSSSFQSVAAKLFQWKTMWRERGLGPVFSEALNYDFGGSKTLLEHLTYEDQAQDYIDWMQIVELLLEKESLLEQDMYRYFCDLRLLYSDQNMSIKQRTIQSTNTVTIMTTHMSKGLEFDVVFALGLASRHFLDDENHVERDAEKMRLFYVAMTRAKRRVYLPTLLTPEKSVDPGSGSAAELFMSQWGTSSEEVLDGLSQIPNISVEIADAPADLTPIEAQKPPALQPVRSHALTFTRKAISSYSSLVKEMPFEKKDAIIQNEDEITLHSMPAGASVGTLLHDLIERLLKSGLHKLDQVPKLESVIEQSLKKTLLNPWMGVICQSLKKLFRADLGGFCLADVDAIMCETEFLFSVDEKLSIRGFADLIFTMNEKVYVVDWKSNLLGTSDDAYTRDELEMAMTSHDYFLQARIYSAALTRWWRLYDERAPSEFFGGAYYVFLRGIDCDTTSGIYHFQPLGDANG